MRFVSLINSAVGKARRAVAQAVAVAMADEKASPAEIARVIRQLGVRVNTLEAAAVQEATEFEVACSTAGALVSMRHGYTGPVRWYVVHWGKVPGVAAPTAAPILVYDDSSTTDILVLKSYTAGRAIVRVEPSFHFVENN